MKIFGIVVFCFLFFVFSIESLAAEKVIECFSCTSSQKINKAKAFARDERDIITVIDLDKKTLTSLKFTPIYDDELGIALGKTPTEVSTVYPVRSAFNSLVSALSSLEKDYIVPEYIADSPYDFVGAYYKQNRLAEYYRDNYSSFQRHKDISLSFITALSGRLSNISLPMVWRFPNGAIALFLITTVDANTGKLYFEFVKGYDSNGNLVVQDENLMKREFEFDSKEAAIEYASALANISNIPFSITFSPGFSNGRVTSKFSCTGSGAGQKCTLYFKKSP